MKQTAVDLLVDELTRLGYNFKLYKKEIEHAKEMEKQQIIDARVNGVAEGIDICDNFITEDISKNHEKYYNETFNK